MGSAVRDPVLPGSVRPLWADGVAVLTLCCIVGDRGSGKTLIATALAVDDDDERPIYANYKINSPRWTRLEPSMLLDLRDCVVVMDEAYLWLDCRTRGKLQEYMSYVLFQSRKDGIDFITTSQLFGSLDLRFRELAEVIVMAEHKKDGFHYVVMRQSNTNPQVRKLFLPNVTAARVFPLYDTNEKLPINPDLVGAAVQDKAVLLPEVDRLVKILEAENDLRKLSKPAVKNWCLRAGVSSTMADLVFDAVKAKLASR